MNILGLLLILLSLFTFDSAAQPKERFMSYGESVIYYSSVADAENKLIEHIRTCKDNTGFPSGLFADLILKDERCFEYDFIRLAEASRRVTFSPLAITTSDDGNLRLYHWASDLGLREIYSGITSYRNDDEIHSHKCLGCEDADDDIGRMAHGVIEMHTISGSSGNSIYLTKTQIESGNYRYTTLRACTIASGRLQFIQIFPQESGYGSYMEYTRLAYPEDKSDVVLDGIYLMIPETADGAFSCEGRLTGRSLQYRFDGYKYRHHGISYPKGLYNGLCNYKNNVVVINAHPWILRIDSMPDGSLRYASWKNKEESMKPDLLLSNGQCVSSGFDNQKYIFRNGEYFYEISWTEERYMGFSLPFSWKLIIKHNSKVLMTLTSK